MDNTIHVGDKLLFGRYPQGVNGEVMPLRWDVLAVQNGQALLITDKMIDCLPYHEALCDVMWESCTLRAWLNRDFLADAFDAEEWNRIVPVIHRNAAQARFDMADGPDTEDAVFALSVEEVAEYFSLDRERKVYATPYAAQKRADVVKRSNGALWWLRTSGGTGHHAANVHFIGGVNYYGNEITDSSIHIRPALWLRL